MCGHATIALARWAVESGRVAKADPETIVRLQCPCGLVVASVATDGQRVRFESVPSFAYALDRIAPTPTWGPVTVDIAYGGAFYAFLAADSIGLDLHTSPMRAIVDAGEEIARAAAKAIPIEHPDEPDLAFLYGTILTDGGDGANGRPSRNVCIFAGRQIDRSPTGSGVTARMALQIARRQARVGDERQFESCTGALFTGKVVREAAPVGPRKAVIVEVGGIAPIRSAKRASASTTTIPCAKDFLSAFRVFPSSGEAILSSPSPRTVSLRRRSGLAPARHVLPTLPSA